MDWHIAVVQTKPRKGDYAYSLARLGNVMAQLDASEEPVDLMVLPECALTGYFLQGGVAEVARSATQLFAELQDLYRARTKAGRAPLDVIIGFPERHEGRLYNAALYATLSYTASEGGIRYVHRKFFLPTYGVFDESRYVNRGRHIDTFETRIGRSGILICEDAWHSITGTILALKGAQVIYIPIASPARGFTDDTVANLSYWHRVARSIAEEHAIYVVTSSLVGFEGGKGFVGSSIVVAPNGEILVTGPLGEECVLRATIDLDVIPVVRASLPLLGDLETRLPDLLRELQAAGIPAETGAWQ
jgi:predicted amidohydrolase